jgi:hypothetical protein
MDPHTIRKYSFEFQFQKRSLPSLTEDELKTIAKRHPSLYRQIHAWDNTLVKLRGQLPGLQERMNKESKSFHRDLLAAIQDAVKRGLSHGDNSQWDDLKAMNLNSKDLSLLLPLSAEQIELVIQLAHCCEHEFRQGD